MNKCTIYILTGAVHSGKTTALTAWSQRTASVIGVLSPDIEGKRHFMLLPGRKILPMEATETDTRILEIGRWRFSKDAFSTSIDYLKAQLKQPADWLIIDEIGPLELRNEGFAMFLQWLLNDLPPIHKGILLVVRNEMTERIKAHFSLQQYTLHEICATQLELLK